MSEIKGKFIHFEEVDKTSKAGKPYKQRLVLIETDDKVKVDSLQNVINTLTLQLNNIKEYKVKDNINHKRLLLFL